jgi:hypothetical protein
MTTETEAETETSSETNKRDLTLNLSIPVGNTGTVSISSKGSKSDEFIDFEANIVIKTKTSDINECINFVNTLAQQVAK